MASRFKFFFSHMTILVILISVCVLLLFITNLQSFYFMECKFANVDMVRVNYWSHCVKYNSYVDSECMVIGTNVLNYLQSWRPITLSFEISTTALDIYLESDHSFIYYYNCRACGLSWSEKAKIMVYFTIFEALSIVVVEIIQCVFTSKTNRVSLRKTSAALFLLQIIMVVASCSITTYWLEKDYRNEEHGCKYSWGYFLLYVCLILELVGLVPMCVIARWKNTSDEQYLKMEESEKIEETSTNRVLKSISDLQVQMKKIGIA